MVKTNVKAAFVHNAYVEYRLPLFEKLSTNYTINFFFEFFHSSGGANPKFFFRFLKSFHIMGPYSFSPLLFFSLIRGKYNLFIAGGKGQVNTYIAFLVSRLLRKPFILWDETWCWPRTKERVLAWPLILSTLRKAEAIVVPGSKSKDYYYSIIPHAGKKIFVAPNASMLPQDDMIRLKADKIRNLMNLENKKVILYCGRLIKIKGFEYLLKAFAKLHENNPDTVLILIGDTSGSEYNPVNLQQLCLGAENVHFIGRKENPEKAAFFMLADLVVVPSIFYVDSNLQGPEVWGFAVNEAMSVGKPVVATLAVGAAYDLIQDGINGYVVPDKNQNALLEAIRAIIEDPVKQNSMGIKSLQIIQNGFTYEKMVFGFVEAINHALTPYKKELKIRRG